MFIKVISWSNNNIVDDRTASFYLEKDNWNDYSFYTYYHLHLSGSHSQDGNPILIGGVKILKKGQKKNDRNLIEYGDMDDLSKEFCSLGQSLDYYERIAQLDQELQDKILVALNDIIAHPKLKTTFEDEEGYQTSLLRYFDKNDDIFKMAAILLSRDFQKLPDEDLKFKFRTGDMNNFIEFDFTSPNYNGEWGKESLPSRIAVIIGRNGSGKSTLLSKISRIVFASSNDRKRLKKVGLIEPEGLGFPRIINISYSAFDTFHVPGVRLTEKEQISRDISKGVGRYLFCGVRDISKELEKSIKNFDVDEYGYLNQKSIINDRQTYNILKSIDTLTDEFVYAIKTINEDKEKRNILESAIYLLSNETSLSYLNKLEGINDNGRDFFNDLSTGHKFVLHSIASIIQHIENRSLVLFDEPETHLHPPLLAILMKTIRYILNSKNSFMIVSTHSPVVLQETLSKHAFIIRREGNLVEIDNVEIQTFGESIGLLTSHVFGLSSDFTDYHSELNKVVDSYIDNSSLKTTNENIFLKIEKLFDGEISSQARAYILSRLNSRYEKN